MSMELSRTNGHAARTPRERLFRDRRFGDPNIRRNNLGTIVLALAEKEGLKPGAWLAWKIGRSERFANMLIKGDRKINARDAFAFFAAILE